ncbi:ribosome-binding factor a [Heliomicrobium modesticaldum Ice1]|uniref:Ribosome-binding factor A n=1 Tax=Heliobacterium modesticaldum (strain ATCC 51547 / Ice1) TaxID=498761 RepID=RBFA_HELMI|nr:30S ribosome-binding factor RbfA [Heliomicrobium modesticaldum]B0THR5.1 RecName: Full=Ribosome-binding factor A [Heliomicrobium modesticaldum Ice1]ABZ84848.1 ribosome-binding factor a [Heliomicrobium modesticaldum Ice1]
MAGHRMARMAEEIKRELARLLRDEMKDPRLGFVSITAVEVSGDGRHAKVYVSVMGDESARDNSQAALKQATGFLRTELSKSLRVRYVPELVFLSDLSIERGTRIARLLTEMENHDDAEAPR